MLVRFQLTTTVIVVVVVRVMVAPPPELDFVSSAV